MNKFQYTYGYVYVHCVNRCTERAQQVQPIQCVNRELLKYIQIFTIMIPDYITRDTRL